MTQVSKILQPVLILLLVAFIVMDEVNDRRKSQKESGEMRTKNGRSHEARGEGGDHDKDMSWMSAVNSAATTKKQQKFKNRASPIPQEEWARIDSQACIVGEGGADDGDLQEYQHRAPYALIVGAMKAGTSSLNSYLEEHSKVMSTKMKELHFYDFKFDNYTTTEGILRGNARKGYARVYKRNVAFGKLKANKHLIALDDSPRYLFWSERVPARVLCVTPWVKILAILRNPIDRAFSQYNMFYSKPTKVQKKSVPFTFEQWIENDIKDMRETGVLQDKIPPEQFRNSKEEEAAWKAYTRLGSHAPIGRGLYALQLRQWFSAFEEAGKSLDDVLVIQSELMKSEPDLVYANILEFLGLNPEPLQDNKEHFVGKYKISLSPETRKRLEVLYAPYNQELYELLGDDWAGVWDP